MGASRRRAACRDDPISAELRRSRGEVSSYARQRQITHGERAFRRADISTRQTAAIVVLLAKYQEQVWFRCCRGRWPASCRRVGAEDDPTFCCGVCRRITDLTVCVRSRGQPENLPDNAFRCWSLASGRFRHLTFADRAGRTGLGGGLGPARSIIETQTRSIPFPLLLPRLVLAGEEVCRETLFTDAGHLELMRARTAAASGAAG